MPAHPLIAACDDVAEPLAWMLRPGSAGSKVNQAWLDASMTARILLAWLRLPAPDADLAEAEPETLRYRVLHAAARLVRGGRRRWLKSPHPGPGPRRSPLPGSGSARSRKHPDQYEPVPARGRGTPATRPVGRATVIPGH